MLRPFGKRFIYVLIAALLFAQQGFALHALSHGVDAIKTASSQSSDQRVPVTDRHCDLCLTYAQIAAGAAPIPLSFVAAAFRQLLAVAEFQPASKSPTRSYFSRAPPFAA